MELVTVIGSKCGLFTWLRSTHKTETFPLECNKCNTLAVAYKCDALWFDIFSINLTRYETRISVT